MGDGRGVLSGGARADHAGFGRGQPDGPIGQRLAAAAALLLCALLRTAGYRLGAGTVTPGRCEPRSGTRFSDARRGAAIGLTFATGSALLRWRRAESAADDTCNRALRRRLPGRWSLSSFPGADSTGSPCWRDAAQCLGLRRSALALVFVRCRLLSIGGGARCSPI